MAKTNKLLNRTGNARPYIQRALTDEELRQNVRNAFDSARDVYNELLGGRGPVKLGARVATDTEIQERLKEAIAELREAAERIQGKKEHGARNSFLLLTGITLGVLFNPLFGPQARKWLADKVFGSSDDFTYQGGGNGAPAP